MRVALLPCRHDQKLRRAFHLASLLRVPISCSSRPKTLVGRSIGVRFSLDAQERDLPKQHSSDPGSPTRELHTMMKGMDCKDMKKKKMMMLLTDCFPSTTPAPTKRPMAIRAPTPPPKHQVGGDQKTDPYP